MRYIKNKKRRHFREKEVIRKALYTRYGSSLLARVYMEMRYRMLLDRMFLRVLPPMQISESDLAEASTYAEHK